MFFSNRSTVPLAWLDLTHSKKSLVMALVGISFAVTLMFMELGFYTSLRRQTTEIVGKFNADLIMVNKLKRSIILLNPFPKRRIEQILTFPQVTAAYPLYIEQERSLWLNVETHNRYAIRVLAFNPEYPVFRMPEILEQQHKLKYPNVVLCDRDSRSLYADQKKGVITELAGRKIEIVGNFTLGPDYFNHGTVIMSDQNFQKFFPSRLSGSSKLDKVEIGLIRLVPGTHIESFIKTVYETLPNDIQLYDYQSFVDFERSFWSEASSIGPIFALGVILGIIVGIVICSQILYSDIVERLPQFATLKAIGYPNSYLLKIVLQKSFFLSFFGFLLGMLASHYLYFFITDYSGIKMEFTVDNLILVFFLTVFMCQFAGVVSSRKALALDPAEVF